MSRARLTVSAVQHEYDPLSLSMPLRFSWSLTSAAGEEVAVSAGHFMSPFDAAEAGCRVATGYYSHREGSAPFAVPDPDGLEIVYEEGVGR